MNKGIQSSEEWMKSSEEWWRVMKSVIQLFIVLEYRWIKVFRPIEWRVKTKPLNPWTFSSLQLFLCWAQSFLVFACGLRLRYWLITDLLLTLKINRHSLDYFLWVAICIILWFNIHLHFSLQARYRLKAYETVKLFTYESTASTSDLWRWAGDSDRHICRWRFPRNPKGSQGPCRGR